MEFLKGAKDFTRNPLGIVALFISLIYGIVSLLLGSSVEKLQSIERWPLLTFVVVFPFAVLYVFYKLVTEHHIKLYSPGDYKDDESFLKTLSPKDAAKKLEIEAKEATGDVFFDRDNTRAKESLAGTKERIQKAESYAIDVLSKELGLKPLKGVQISKHKYGFDAAYIVPKKDATILEVKYYSKPMVTYSAVEEFIRRAQLTVEYMSVKTQFVLYLVLDGDATGSHVVVDAWRKSIEDTDLNVDIRVVTGEEIDA
jgi:hypothetical protein